jgi:signal peptidase I
VFWFPGDTTKSYIKRVIGLPGDTIAIDDGTVILNGRVLTEAYVPSEYRDQLSLLPQRIPAGKYFVLGDHRSSSNDSRMWGFVPRSYIYGKAVFVFWPPERLGAVH